mmetsp:Transcript_676/g.2761  ORF Transcript_676/g.2761 Transcript_676/m.2761 type:complete len:360 (-) Transcript_676:553-1632(-)
MRVPRELHRARADDRVGADRREVRRALPGHRASVVRYEGIESARVFARARRVRLVRHPNTRGRVSNQGVSCRSDWSFCRRAERYGGTCRVGPAVGDVRRDVAHDAASRRVRDRRVTARLGLLRRLPLRAAFRRTERRGEHQDFRESRRAVPVFPDARDVPLGVADGGRDVRGDVQSAKNGSERRGGGREREVRERSFLPNVVRGGRVLGHHGAQHQRLFPVREDTKGPSVRTNTGPRRVHDLVFRRRGRGDDGSVGCADDRRRRWLWNSERRRRRSHRPSRFKRVRSARATFSRARFDRGDALHERRGERRGARERVRRAAQLRDWRFQHQSAFGDRRQRGKRREKKKYARRLSSRRQS